jgi:hypothetical protein
MKKKTKLTSYLGGGVAAITASSAHGEIITIDLTSFGITGTNGGVASGALGTIPNFPFSGAGGMKLYNGALSDRFWGLDGDDGLVFAAGSAYSSPTNFSSGATIDGTSSFSGDAGYTAFRYYSDVSPAFGAGSYMGFKTDQGNYGWLEVTWDPDAEEFEILSGAYESVAGVAIAAGDTGGGGVSAIPETSSVLGLAGLVAGSAFLRRRKAA